MEGLVFLAIAIVIIASVWKVFTKAGEAGWASLIPFYNLFVLVRIAGRPWWFFLLFFVPIANIVVSILVSNDISKRFGFGIGMTLLLIFLPFIAYPILGFGSAAYEGGEA